MIEDIYIFFIVCVFLNILFIYIFRVSPVIIKYVKLYKVKIKKNNSNSGSKWQAKYGKFFYNHSKREGSLFIVKILTVFPLCFISYYYQKRIILSSYSKIIASSKMNISESLKNYKHLLSFILLKLHLVFWNEELNYQ